jgi:hypothetical protein
LEGQAVKLKGKKRLFLLAFASVLLFVSVGRSLASYSAVVSVYPSQQSVKVGQTFAVDIRIENISGLQGVDFCLRYDSTILNATKVEEGSFMKSFGPTYIVKQDIQPNYQTNRGRVWFVIVICGNGSATGSGTLATVTFNATAAGEGELDLFSVLPDNSNQVKLITCVGVPIAHALMNGYVVVSDDPLDPPDPPAKPSADVNGDGRVDIIDVSMVARTLGKSVGEPLYESKADLDQNGVIDVRDVAIVAASFGQAL